MGTKNRYQVIMIMITYGCIVYLFMFCILFIVVIFQTSVLTMKGNHKGYPYGLC